MPVVKAYHGGLSVGFTPRVHERPETPRGNQQGWTRKSVRSNLQFLQSVNPQGLHGHGYAVTLTLKDCPPTAQDWATLRDTLLKRWTRMGMIRCHWVTEWTANARPHLHASLYLPEPAKPAEIVSPWLDLCAASGIEARRIAQHVTPVYQVEGWLQYVAKHASRGIHHYQRSPENVPPGWKVRTGRVWGSRGDWPLVDPLTFDVSPHVVHRLRRIIRSRARAAARTRLAMTVDPAKLSEARHGITRARTLLRAPVSYSRVRGMTEWMPRAQVLRVLLDEYQEGWTVMERLQGSEPVLVDCA